MENFEEKASLCALNRIFGFTPKTGHALVSSAGSGKELFSLNDKQLAELIGPDPRFEGRICRRSLDDACKELEKLSGKGISFYGFNEKGYPPLLKECPDAPLGLYIRSNSPAEALWSTGKCISIVGTRDISPYGRTMCRKILEAIAESGEKPTIISGLALGTDITAHRCALELGLPTIAVMATGPESVYPYRHYETARLMAESPGCALVTDYPPGTAPLPCNFLRRNRIIAGAASATILTESKIKGGGMTTCRLAFSYDRDVYALPGRIDEIRSQGCNELIARKLAEPINTVRALIKALGFGNAVNKGSRDSFTELIDAAARGKEPDQAEATQGILTAIHDENGISIEEIAGKTGIGYGKTAEMISRLEIEGIVTVDLLQRCWLKF